MNALMEWAKTWLCQYYNFYIAYICLLIILWLINILIFIVLEEPINDASDDDTLTDIPPIGM